MKYLRDDPNYLKIALLKIRKLKWGSRFVMLIEGNLTRKGARGASRVQDDLRAQLTEHVGKSRWKYIPRAKVAVRMHFRAGRHQPPDLQNLVKFYLDPLCSVVFADDRQVAYLEAEASRHFDKELPSSIPNAYVFVEVQRLTDFKTRLDLYQAVSRDRNFQDYLKYDIGKRELLDDDDRDDDDEPAELALLDAYRLLLSRGNLPDEKRSDYEQKMRELMRPGRLEQGLLQHYSKVSNFDRPGGYRFNFLDIEPFTINLGDLPEIGRSDEYKKRIRNQVRSLGSKNRLQSITIPVELDVQVIPSTLQLGKDLDNIMRDIAPILREELLHQSSYLHGYRIYVVDKLSDEAQGNIRIKLLPMHAIYDYRNKIDETLELAEDWIEKQLHGF